MYRYRCKILKVIDGDTVDVDIDLGFGVWMHKERVRVYGIDTPESRTRDLVEKKFGKASKKHLQNLLSEAERLTLMSHDKGKFGRILGEIFAHHGEEEFSINQRMIDDHHAVPYSGQSKEDIKLQHLENRKILQENGTVEVQGELLV